METKNSKEKKWHPVNYAGFWHIQDSEYYGPNDVLNAEDVGEDTAEQNAILAASAPELKLRIQELEYGNSLLPDSIEQNRIDSERIKELEEEKDSYYSMYNEQIQENQVLRESYNIS